MNNKKNYFLQGVFFLILAQTMVGFNIVMSKLLLQHISILVLLILRLTMSTFISVLFHFLINTDKNSIKTHLLNLNKRDWIFLLAQALTAGALFNFLMLTGLNYTDANVAGIITSALPAIIAIMSFIVVGEEISIQKILGIIFTTIGLVIIACDSLDIVNISHSFSGDIIVLLSLLPEATYYILCKIYSNKLPTFLTSFILNGINLLVLVPIIPFIHCDSLSISTSNWLILFTMSLSSSLFFVFWQIGSARVDGIIASLSTASMTISTVIISWIILGEELTKLQLIGMSLVILSIFISARRQ